MARKLSQSDPALSIDFFVSGFYTYRSQLFAPFKGIGVNVVSFHDPVIDGINFELTDKLEWQRRSGFSIFCPIALADSEIVNQFYSTRLLTGEVLAFVDTSVRLATFTSTSLTTIASKTTDDQGYIATLGNLTYFADGTSADYFKYDSTNTTAWGLAAPTVAPAATGLGFWQPDTGYAIGNTVLDTNGNIESVSAILANNGAIESPEAFTTISLSGGTGSWTGSIGSGGTIAQTLNSVGHTNYLFFYDFNLNIPSDATIVGVVAEVPRRAAAGIVKDQSVKLVIGGSVVGTDHASGADWNPAALTSFIYGGPLDLWGVGGGIAPADANTNGPSGFGLAVAADVTNTNFFQLVQAGAAHALAQNVIYTLPHPVMAGDTLVIGVCVFHETFISITDNMGNTYHLAVSSTSGELTNYVYVASNIAAGITTIKVTIAAPAGNAFASINAHEFSGVLSVSPVDVTGHNAFGGTPFNSGTVTTTDANDLIFTYVYVNSGGAAIPVGYTFGTSDTYTAAGGTQQLASAFIIKTSTGSFVSDWSRGSVGCTVALKSAGVGTALVGGGAPSAPVITVYYKLPSGLGGPGLSGDNEPIWSTTTGASVNDGGLTWTNYGPIDTWFPLTAYPVPVVVLDLNGNLQLATAITNPAQTWDSGVTYAVGDVVFFGGTYWISTVGSNMGIAPNANYTVATASGSTTTTVAYWAQSQNPNVTGSIAPVWNTNLGGITDDGNYTWTNIGPGSQLASFGYAYVYAYRTIYGHLTTGSPFSNNTGAILGPLQGSITGFSITSNVVTFEGNNNFQPGDVFEPSGLTVGTYLNDQALTVVTAVPSATFPLTSVSVTTNVVTITAINNLVVGQSVTFQNVANATFLNGVTATVLSSGLSGSQFEIDLTTTDYGPTDDTGNVLINGSWTASFTHGDVSEVADAGVAIPLIAALSGVGTGSVLCNSVANITAVGVSANVVTIQAINNFQPGLWVTLVGLTNAIFLNGQQFQVIGVDQQVGTENTYFQVFLETPNYASTGDTGTATFNAIEIYRTSDGGGSYLFDGAVTNPGAGVVWSYNDFITDNNLDILLVAALNHQNDPPPGAPGSSIPTAGSVLVYWQGRLWMAVGNYVYFDAGPDCTNGIPEESWPPANRFQFAGPALNMVPTADGVGLLVYLADRVAVILGGPETISFYPADALGNFGISNPNAVFRDGSIIGQFTTQKQYFELIDKTKQETGEHIGDYLASNFSADSTYVTMHRDGLDVGVFMSNGVDQVLRYGSNVNAWSLPAFPACGAGALRSIETSVGVYTLMLASPKGGVTASAGPVNPLSGVTVAGTGTAWSTPENIVIGSPTDYATVTFSAVGSSQALRASSYTMTIPVTAVVQGVAVMVIGKQSETSGDLTLTITPTNPASGASSHTFSFSTTNTTLSFGGGSDLWGMPWSQPYLLNAGALSFDIVATFNGVSMSPEAFVAEVQVTVTYQTPGNYLYARDLNSWGDDGQYGANNGSPYVVANVVIGSITLSQPGAPLFPLQHVVGYFDAAGTLDNGGPSVPDIWILPNEINTNSGVGFVQLPEYVQEPPVGQNHPSKSLLALRWPVNMVNSQQMSQFIHHLQVKIQFEPENAPNTIKSISFKEDQE